MDFKLKYEIIKRYLPCPSDRRRGLLMSPGVRYIVAHDTGNPGTTARQNVAYFTNQPNLSASAHLFVDGEEIIECVPALTGPPEKAWHVLYNTVIDAHLYGHKANDAAIGIEYCYGGAIDADQAYARYVWLIAYACHRYGLDPARAVVGHFLLDPQRKTDPVSGLMHSRRSYDQLLRDVVSEYHECLGQPDPHAAEPKREPVPVVVVTTVALNIRRGQPNCRAEIHATAAPGTRLAYVASVDNGQAINGNTLWYQDADRNFFWSGATRPAPTD